MSALTSIGKSGCCWLYWRTFLIPWWIMEKSDSSALMRVKSMICSCLNANSKLFTTRPLDEKCSWIMSTKSHWTCGFTKHGLRFGNHIEINNGELESWWIVDPTKSITKGFASSYGQQALSQEQAQGECCNFVPTVIFEFSIVWRQLFLSSLVYTHNHVFERMTRYLFAPYLHCWWQGVFSLSLGFDSSDLFFHLFHWYFLHLKQVIVKNHFRRQNVLTEPNHSTTADCSKSGET